MVTRRPDGVPRDRARSLLMLAGALSTVALVLFMVYGLPAIFGIFAAELEAAREAAAG